MSKRCSKRELLSRSAKHAERCYMIPDADLEKHEFSSRFQEKMSFLIGSPEKPSENRHFSVASKSHSKWAKVAVIFMALFVSLSFLPKIHANSSVNRMELVYELHPDILKDNGRSPVIAYCLIDENQSFFDFENSWNKINSMDEFVLTYIPKRFSLDEDNSCCVNGNRYGDIRYTDSQGRHLIFEYHSVTADDIYLFGKIENKSYIEYDNKKMIYSCDYVENWGYYVYSLTWVDKYDILSIRIDGNAGTNEELFKVYEGVKLVK